MRGLPRVRWVRAGSELRYALPWGTTLRDADDISRPAWVYRVFRWRSRGIGAPMSIPTSVLVYSSPCIRIMAQLRAYTLTDHGRGRSRAMWSGKEACKRPKRRGAHSSMRNQSATWTPERDASSDAPPAHIDHDREARTSNSLGWTGRLRGR